jgi:hypothetical protein
VRSSPDRPLWCPLRSGHAGPGGRPARPLASIPASYCPFAEPPPRLRGPRISPDTSRGLSPTGRGSHISHTPDPAAPASGSQRAGKGSDHETLRRERDEKQASNQAKNTYLKKPERRAPVEPQRLSQGVIEGGAVIMEFLPQRLLGLGLVEKGTQHPGATKPCSGCQIETSGAGGAAQDVDASALCAGRCDITQPSDRTTSTSGVHLGAGPDPPSISPSWGRNRHQQGPPPSRGPWQISPPSEPIRTLGRGHGAPRPARPPPSSLPVAALQPWSWCATAHPPPPCSLPPVVPSPSATPSSGTSLTSVP